MILYSLQIGIERAMASSSGSGRMTARQNVIASETGAIGSGEEVGGDVEMSGAFGDEENVSPAARDGNKHVSCSLHIRLHRSASFVSCEIQRERK